MSLLNRNVFRNHPSNLSEQRIVSIFHFFLDKTNCFPLLSWMSSPSSLHTLAGCYHKVSYNVAGKIPSLYKFSIPEKPMKGVGRRWHWKWDFSVFQEMDAQLLQDHSHTSPCGGEFGWNGTSSELLLSWSPEHLSHTSEGVRACPELCPATCRCKTGVQNPGSRALPWSGNIQCRQFPPPALSWAFPAADFCSLLLFRRRLFHELVASEFPGKCL